MGSCHYYYSKMRISGGRERWHDWGSPWHRWEQFSDSVQLFAVWPSGPFPEPHQPFCRAASSFPQGLFPKTSVSDHFFLILSNCLSVKPLSSHISVCHLPAHSHCLLWEHSLPGKNQGISKVVIGCVAKGVLASIQCLHLYSIMADQQHALSFQDVGFTKTNFLEAGDLGAACCSPTSVIPMQI